MDIRVINTKSRIQKGLIKAINQKPLYDIKDKDVIANAQVSASSYYKYYANKTEVLNDLETDLISAFKSALTADSQDWYKIKHSPNKKDINHLIDQNIIQLVDFVTDKKIEVSALVSKNGDPNFSYQMIEFTTRVIQKLIMHYFSIYDQTHILEKNNLQLQIVAKRYAIAFLDPLFIWLRYSEEMPLSDVKELIKLMVLQSPYDASTHGFKLK